MAIPTPGESRIRKLTVGGQDLTTYVREISVYESIFNPFKSAQILLIDSSNLTNRLKLEGNEDVEIVFDCGTGKVYEAKMKAMSMMNSTKASSLRADGFMLNAVSESFMKNMTSKAQKSFKNIQGSEAIEKIHKDLGIQSNLKVHTKSKGLIGESEPYLVSNMPPFDAIHGIRTRLTSDQYKTGAYSYYEDASQHNLIQIEQMFSNLSPQENFTQRATMGSSFSDFGGQSRNIIGYHEKTSFSEGGKFNIADVLNTRKDSKVSTYSSMEAKYNEGQVKQAKSGKAGGVNEVKNDNGSGNGNVRTSAIIPHDKRMEKNSIQAEKSAEEQRYINDVKNGPACTIQVMLDSGINCTVGKGVSANIAAPIGDLQQGGASGNMTGGNMLVVNLRHHIKNYDSKPRATTIMELAKGGYNT